MKLDSRTALSVSLFLVVLAVATAAFAGGPVALKSHARIDGDIVRLGDLFEGLGPEADTAVARAPAPGEPVELEARWLAALAKRYGLAWRPQSRFERILVERDSRVVEAERIRDEVLLALTERAPDSDFELRLDNPDQRLFLPGSAEATVALRGLVYNPASGRFRAELLAPAAGPALVKAAVSGRAIEMIEIPALAESVEPGDPIAAEDVQWLRIRADRNHRGLARSFEDLVGKSPRRPISIGQPIRLGDLRAPVAVAKNSLVTIRLATDRMVLTAQGRALENGATGAAIRVMNTKSNAVINARVVHDGLVEAIMASPQSAFRSE